jgi:hypothetical protein
MTATQNRSERDEPPVPAAGLVQQELREHAISFVRILMISILIISSRSKR